MSYPVTDSKVYEAFQVFQNLVVLSQHFLNRGQHLEAAVVAQIAVECACFRHTGLFNSPRLENILMTIGRETVQKYSHPRRPILSTGLPHNILHVATCAKLIGGDSRFVWRWIQRDSGRRHSVVLTRQEGIEIPQTLIDAVTRTDGCIGVLDEHSGDPIARARELRAYSQNADLIVLHLYPEDVIPLIAFADKEALPPVIYVNHADQLFWLGVSIADVIAELRESGVRLSQECRGIKKERMTLLPIPMVPVRKKFSRPEAKTQLGLKEDTVVILSIARAVKYVAIAKPSFIDIIVPVLEKHKNTIAIVIGPDQRDQWAIGYQRTQGRLLALGRRDDTALFYEAADIYVDSFPFTSNTSLLEAGNYSLPLVSYCPYASDAEVLCAGAPGLTQTLLSARNFSCYEDILSGLITNQALRIETGKNTRNAILEAHCGEGWQIALKNLYRTALTVPRKSATSTTTTDVAQKAIGELDILLNRLYPHFSFPGFIEKHIRPLPIALRIRLLIKLLKVDRTFSFGMFLPFWLERRVSGQVRWRQWPGINRWLGENLQ